MIFKTRLLIHTSLISVEQLIREVEIRKKELSIRLAKYQGHAKLTVKQCKRNKMKVRELLQNIEERKRTEENIKKEIDEMEKFRTQQDLNIKYLEKEIQKMINIIDNNSTSKIEERRERINAIIGNRKEILTRNIEDSKPVRTIVLNDGKILVLNSFNTYCFDYPNSYFQNMFKPMLLNFLELPASEQIKQVETLLDCLDCTEEEIQNILEHISERNINS